MVDYLGFAYAAIVAVGGIVGYIKAGSVMSLGAGLTFGTLAAYGARQYSEDSSKFHVLLIISCMLATLMGYRFYNSQKFMPAGLTCSLSVATALRIVLARLVSE